MSARDILLYRLPELLRAKRYAPVFICESEKSCDALYERLLIATTNPGGAGKWCSECSAHLRGRDVVILPDNDEPGRDHAADVARQLEGIARSVRILSLPNLPPKASVSDWFAAGGTAEELERLVVEAAENSRRQVRRHDICELAQNLARNNGYAVFPCREDKTPATLHGFKDAATDAASVSALWGRYPGPLVGVATGAVSGIGVLDVDIKADEARAWWHQHQHLLPATRTYSTRSGGFHLVFRHRPGVKCAVGKPTLGIDSRGDGGYIIFWFAHGFECLDHAAPAPWPDWLFNYFWPPAVKLQAGVHYRARNDDAAVDGIVRCVREAQELTRNNKLYWATKRLQERQVAKAEARRLLTDAAKDAGLAAFEIARTIDSAWGSAA